jgi:hypothetical protein
MTKGILEQHLFSMARPPNKIPLVLIWSDPFKTTTWKAKVDFISEDSWWRAKCNKLQVEKGKGEKFNSPVCLLLDPRMPVSRDIRGVVSLFQPTFSDASGQEALQIERLAGYSFVALPGCECNE